MTRGFLDEEKVFGTSRTQKNFQTTSRLETGTVCAIFDLCYLLFRKTAPSASPIRLRETKMDFLACRLFFALPNSKAACALDRNGKIVAAELLRSFSEKAMSFTIP